jgi:hypothetical protein
MTARVAAHKVTKKWTTRDGQRIRICDMTDEHLLNTIRLCQRAHERAKLEIPYPDFCGDMAQFYAEREFDNFLESGPEVAFPLYPDLVDEAYRRRLDIEEVDE